MIGEFEFMLGSYCTYGMVMGDETNFRNYYYCIIMSSRLPFLFPCFQPVLIASRLGFPRRRGDRNLCFILAIDVQQTQLGWMEHSYSLVWVIGLYGT